MAEAPVRLDLAHGGRDAVLARRHEDLFQRKQPPAARVPDQVDEREAALAQQLLDLVAPPVDLERRIAACQLGVSSTAAAGSRSRRKHLRLADTLRVSSGSLKLTHLGHGDEGILCVEFDAVERDEEVVVHGVRMRGRWSNNKAKTTSVHGG